MDRPDRRGEPVSNLPQRSSWPVILVGGLVTTAVAVTVDYLIFREVAVGLVVGIASILGGFMTASEWFRRSVIGTLRETSRWGAGWPEQR